MVGSPIQSCQLSRGSWPVTTVDRVRSILEELSERNPRAKDLDPNKFFDDRFVRQLQASDFIEALYR